MSSVDHLFIDFAKISEETYGIALVRTNDRGKVLTAAGVSGPFDHVLTVIDRATSLYSAPYVVVAERALDKRVSLDNAAVDHNVAPPFKGRAWLDFGQVAWALVLCDLVPNRSVGAVGEHFRVAKPDDLGKSLTGDCAYLVEVYWALARTYRTALPLEAKARDAIASIDTDGMVSNLRRIVGL